MKRFAAISLGALGDFLLTLPLLRELRHRGPVAAMARSAYRDLLPDWLADAPFLAVDGIVGTRLFTPDATFPETLSDTVTDAEVHVFSRPDDLLAENLRHHGVSRLVWHDPRPAEPPHVVARFFTDAGIPLPENWERQPSMPVKAKGNALWIHAGSGSADKDLPLPFLAHRGQLWQQETGQQVIVSFGEADLARRVPLQEAFARYGIDYEEAVCPSLAELRARIGREARQFLGADTGVTHLAAALGKEVWVGYRATDPAIWRPLGHCHVLPPAELEREPSLSGRVSENRACISSRPQTHS